MSDSGRARDYRQDLYDNYLSLKVKPEGEGFSEKIYRSWGKATEARLKGWLPEDRHTPILDIGCGAGNFLFLLSQLGYTNLTGVDLSAEHLALARHWCPQAELIHGDVREFLLEKSGHFGLITGFDIIEHFRKDEILPLIALIAQALYPGGRVILQTPNAASPWVGSVAYGDFTHEWFFTPESLSSILSLSGLVNFEARPCGPYIHGMLSFIRMILWQVINLSFTLVNLIECGGISTKIYTRVFLGTAMKV